MLSNLLTLAIKFGIFLLFVLVVGTVHSFIVQRVPKRREMRNLPPDQLFPEWFELASGFSNQLYGLGFVRSGYIAAAPPARINVELLIHPTLPVSADVILMLVGDRRLAYVELKTRFDDGHNLATINSTMPQTFIYPDNIEIHRSGALWMRELLSEHLAAAEAISHGRAPKPAPQIQTVQSMVDDEQEMAMYQVKCGLMRECADGENLRYTARGAFRTTFRVWRRMSFLHARPPSPANQRMDVAA